MYVIIIGLKPKNIQMNSDACVKIDQSAMC